MDDSERGKRWAETAVRRELEAIEALPMEVNIRKPNNLYWRSLFAIAGIVNGGYLSKDEAFALIVQASQHLSLLEKAIAYQWNRACQRARPRHPRNL
jgi:hypothetical protein